MAEYVLRHGDILGRVELIIKEKGKLLHLDMNKGGIGEKVMRISDNQGLHQLFKDLAE